MFVRVDDSWKGPERVPVKDKELSMKMAEGLGIATEEIGLTRIYGRKEIETA